MSCDERSAGKRGICLMSTARFCTSQRGEGAAVFPGRLCRNHKSHTLNADATPRAHVVRGEGWTGGHQGRGTSRAARCARPCSSGCARRMNCGSSAVTKAKCVQCSQQCCPGGRTAFGCYHQLMQEIASSHTRKKKRGNVFLEQVVSPYRAFFFFPEQLFQLVFSAGR